MPQKRLVFFTRVLILTIFALGMFLGSITGPVLAKTKATSVISADVAVVGAGYSGLLAARTVARAGFSVAILEARDRVGGRACSVQLANGVVADLGAGWVINPTHSQMIALAKEYGVELYPTHIAGDGLVMEGNNIERLPMSNLSMSLDHPPDELMPAALVLKRLISMSETLDAGKPWLYKDAELLDNTTFLEWLKTNYANLNTQNWQIISRTIDGYIGPMSSTSVLNVLLYTKMSHGFKNYLDMSKWLRVDGGVAAIAQTIALELKKNPKVSLLLNNRVYRIDQSATGAVVYATDTTVSARRVIVSIPPPVACGIDFQQDSKSVTPSAGALAMNQRITMMPGFKAMFVYKTPFWRKQGLSGYAVSQSEPVGSVWDASPKNGRLGCLIMLSNPFNTEPRLVDLDSNARKQILADSLVKFFGPEARQYTSYAENIWDAEPFSLGSVGVPTIGAWTSFGQYLRKPMGHVFWAGSERATESWAQMDGAAKSGIHVGQEVIASLQEERAKPHSHL